MNSCEQVGTTRKMSDARGAVEFTKSRLGADRINNQLRTTPAAPPLNLLAPPTSASRQVCHDKQPIETARAPASASGCHRCPLPDANRGAELHWEQL
jgi:hypothetical protein